MHTGHAGPVKVGDAGSTVADTLHAVMHSRRDVCAVCIQRIHDGSVAPHALVVWRVCQLARADGGHLHVAWVRSGGVVGVGTAEVVQHCRRMCHGGVAAIALQLCALSRCVSTLCGAL